MAWFEEPKIYIARGSKEFCATLYNRITTLELGFEKKKTLETTVAVQNLRKEVAFFLR